MTTKQQARAAGISLIAGRKIATDTPTGGFYVKSAAFGPAPCDSRIGREEIFGPVLTVMPFDDQTEAIAWLTALTTSWGRHLDGGFRALHAPGARQALRSGVR
ncbi:aldehyde dehydrogenase family protein [Roseovarius azorensis]|uniref:aldehyde dehydrogenase family protein n=1 Tax=Roseovarius azorensis TaxID=1287727 RepID=UPI002481CEA9|nr:aldehyde dehydrogenase family protein [Roseovarius azorensis]